MYAYKPRTMQSVVALVERELQVDSWRQYMATVTWSVGRMQSERYPIAPYEKPQFRPEITDNRSGHEIVSGILSKLGGNT